MKIKNPIFVVAIIVVMALLSCIGPPEATNVNLIRNPNENAPLAGILSLTSDRPVTVNLRIDDGEHMQNITPDDTFKTEHEVQVLGLRPGRRHWVSATLRDKQGRNTVIDSLEIETPPLPEDFPPIELIKSDTSQMEPGITMFSLFRWLSQFDDDPDWGIAIAVDHTGDVIWYMTSEFFIDEPRRMYNGNLIFGGHNDGRLFEMDILGNIINEWHTSGSVIDELPEGSIPVATDGFHHDVLELPSGNFLGLGLEVATFADFPLEYPPGTKRGKANVAGDVIIEFTKAGETVHNWKVIDILDPQRLGSGSLNRSFYEKLYEAKYDTIPFDISHCNAIYYLEDEDAVLVSSYQQCVIYKVDMTTGELIWMLGDPFNWSEPWSGKLLQSKGDVIWPCHQHGIEMTPRGTLLVFDNGAGRNIPPQEPLPPAERFSRAVEYLIDEEAGTVEEVWSYGPDQEHFVSPFISDADYLPETGNVLITDGGRFIGEDGKPMNTFGGHQWARILEVTHDTDSRKVWELIVRDPEVRYSMYRAQRFKSLYPKLDRPTG